jgi:hypothetical protein
MIPVRAIIHVIGPSIAYVPLTRGMHALIDSSDAAIVGKFNWFAHGKMPTDLFYAHTNVYKNGSDGERSILKLHRLLLGLSFDSILLGDHINANTLDNRRANLRIADFGQNVRNTRIRKNNSSGLKGVSFDKFTNRWLVVITHNRKQIHIGRYDTKELAHAAYCDAAERMHGEFARIA